MALLLDPLCYLLCLYLFKLVLLWQAIVPKSLHRYTYEILILALARLIALIPTQHTLFQAQRRMAYLLGDCRVCN